MSASKAAFVAESNGAYGYGCDGEAPRIDKMRATEFPHLEGSVYLDHAGATTYSKPQLDAVFRELQGGLFTNPHSAMGDSHAASTSAKMETVRRQVLQFFSADEEQYTVIFTSGATAALKLVGESFPWGKQSTFAHSMDSHTSVLGLRGYAASCGAAIACVGIDELDALEEEHHDKHGSVSTNSSTPVSLFAFPAECNFSGVRHSLSLVETIRAGRWKPARDAAEGTKWLVLVDAAKYVATQRLDLSVYRPDFVVLSFYKIFGYPTGLGALIARRTALSYLDKKYFGGGTVKSILAGRNFSVPRGVEANDDASSPFADGTQSFLSILALRHGMQVVENLGMLSIAAHTAALRRQLVNRLSALQHWNSQPSCKIYGGANMNGKANRQGPVVACNFLRPDGSYVGYSEFHQLAAIHNIHLRTGCFCNPGACQHYLGLKESDLMTNIEAGHVCGDDIDLVNGLPTGAIRFSLGYMSTFEDVMAVVDFVERYFVYQSAPAQGTMELNRPTRRCSTNSPRPYLCKLTLFPIKSCAGMVVDQWPIGSRGLLFDREFAIVDLSTSSALTLKTAPELCFFHPVIDLARETLTISFSRPSNSETRQLQKTESPTESKLATSHSIPLRADISIAKQQNNVDSRNMRVCADACKARDVGAAVSEWLSSWLGRQCALVRVSSDHLRASKAGRSKSLAAKQSPERWNPESDESRVAKHSQIQPRSRPTIGFANQAQYLLISRQSIRHFNAVLQSVDSSLAVHEDAFRANLIVDGCAASFQEDQWGRLRIGDGGAVFDVSGPCSRCSVINLDQCTGRFDRQPLQVLSTYRRQRSSIFFGQFLTARSSSSGNNTWLRVGDRVEVEP